MKLWLRVRRAWACAITILVVAIVLVPTRGWYLPLPNLLGGPPLEIPLAFLIPLAVAIVLALGFTIGDPLVEIVASRPLHLLDAAYALSTAGLTLAACALSQRLGGTDLALAAGRNALGYVGLTLIGGRLLGVHAAAVLPVGCAIATCLLGSTVYREPRWWAWPIAPADNSLSWGLAVACLFLGIAVALIPKDAADAER